MNDYETELQQFAQLLSNAKDLFVITGAGISADSGLPTYRGIGGLYEDNDTEDGIPIQEALSATVFRSQPEITWKYLSQIEKTTRTATHNRGHEVLAQWEQRFNRMWILTQNVDGFHASAGSKNVIEIHGNMHRLKCTQCGHVEHSVDYSGMTVPPRCPRCQAMARPDVVLFEEQLPDYALTTLDRESSNPFDLVVSIGTSNYFPYITQPIYQAYRDGISTVEINPSTTAVSDFVDIKIKLGAQEALDRVSAMMS